MSSQQLSAYSRSPGAFLHLPQPGPDVETEARELLDRRDAEHLQAYGHLPGQAPVCTLPPRSAYVTAARAQVTPEARGLIPPGSTTEEAQRLVDAAAPWWHRPSPGADPALEAARRELAQQVAAQQVTG
jgi:hypothetical protein